MSTRILHRPLVGELWGDSPRAKKSNPVTSHEAADMNDVHRSIGLVLDILRAGPLTDFEIEAAASDRGERYTVQRLRTARAALVERGLVEESGIYRLTPHNRRAVVWAVSA